MCKSVNIIYGEVRGRMAWLLLEASLDIEQIIVGGMGL